jgi:hypothetical protein
LRGYNCGLKYLYSEDKSSTTNVLHGNVAMNPSAETKKTQNKKLKIGINRLLYNI